MSNEDPTLSPWQLEYVQPLTFDPREISAEEIPVINAGLCSPQGQTALQHVFSSQAPERLIPGAKLWLI